MYCSPFEWLPTRLILCLRHLSSPSLLTIREGTAKDAWTNYVTANAGAVLIVYGVWQATGGCFATTTGGGTAGSVLTPSAGGTGSCETFGLGLTGDTTLPFQTASNLVAWIWILTSFLGVVWYGVNHILRKQYQGRGEGRDQVEFFFWLRATLQQVSLIVITVAYLPLVSMAFSLVVPFVSEGSSPGLFIFGLLLAAEYLLILPLMMYR